MRRRRRYGNSSSIGGLVIGLLLLGVLITHSEWVTRVGGWIALWVFGGVQLP